MTGEREALLPDADEIDNLAWLVWFARKVRGTARAVAYKAWEQNPELRRNAQAAPPSGLDAEEVRSIREATRRGTDVMVALTPLVLAVREWRDTPRVGAKGMREGQRLEQAILDAINDFDEYARLSSEPTETETPHDVAIKRGSEM